MTQISPIREFSSFYYVSDGVISTCEHYYTCVDPLYMGRCRKDCWERHRKMTECTKDE
jgi:hypothetical protein